MRLFMTRAGFLGLRLWLSEPEKEKGNSLYNPPMNNHRQIWNEFCTTHNISTNKVPLFETSSGLAVKTKQISKPTPRSILCRSPEMDTLIRAECAKLIDDWKQKAFAYDGLIYMMLDEEPDGVVPLYIALATIHPQRKDRAAMW